MRSNAKGALVVCAALLAAPGWAWGQAKHFTLTVPVEVHSLLSGIQRVNVDCSVATTEGMTDIVGLGGAYKDIDTSTGNFTGNVVVAFDAQPGKDPASATFYKCWLTLYAGPTATMQPSAGAMSPAFRPKPGTSFVPEVTGPVP